MSNSQKWIMGRRAMMVSLLFLHIWGTMIIYAVTFGGRESTILSTMFETACTGIFSTILLMVVGKSWKEFMPAKFLNAAAADTEKKE